MSKAKEDVSRQAEEPRLAYNVIKQISLTPIMHPVEQNSSSFTAISAYQLIKKLGCLPVR